MDDLVGAGREEDGPPTAITGLDQNVRLNRELWNLAERLANGQPIVLAE